MERQKVKTKEGGFVGLDKPARLLRFRLVIGFVLLGFLSTSYATRIGFVTGDSFSDGSRDWPVRMNSAMMHSTAIPGQKLVEMADTFESQLNQHIFDHNIDFAIVQGGVNDVASSGVSLIRMRAAIVKMASLAESAGLPLFIVNIAPWSSAPRSILRDEIDLYNSWLEQAFKEVDDIVVVDIYSVLEDPLSPQHLNPIYDFDGVHPTLLGHQLIADVVDRAVLATIPSPATLWLFILGVAGMGWFDRHRQRRHQGF